MDFLCIGLSHRTAGVALREKLAFPETQQVEILRSLEGISEKMLISTCNRVELFAVASSIETARLAIHAAMQREIGPDIFGHLYEHQGEAALVHLFRVSASLDSMVIGESQILGQVKESVELARRMGTAKGELMRAAAAAFSCAKRIRTETGIGRLALSMASAAIQLADKIFGSIAGKSVLIVGAGEMGRLAARHLLSGGGKIIIINRTLVRAEELAAELQADAKPFEQLPELLVWADLVVCSAASQRPIFTKENVSAATRHRRFRPLFMVDLAVPRDIAPDVNDLDGVYAYDVDDIQKVVAETSAARAIEAAKAEAIIAEEVAHFVRDRAIRESPLVAELRSRAHAIAKSEAERTVAQLGPSLTEKHRRSIESMAMAIVNKLLHQPTTKLRAVSRDPDQRLAGAAAELFGLGGEALNPSEVDDESLEREEESAATGAKR
jgi:glutamyl-tRNA reductase